MLFKIEKLDRNFLISFLNVIFASSRTAPLDRVLKCTSTRWLNTIQARYGLKLARS